MNDFSEVVESSCFFAGFLVHALFDELAETFLSKV